MCHWVLQEFLKSVFRRNEMSELALGFTEEPYFKSSSWEGAAHKDLFAIDLNSGDKKMIVKDLRCNPRLSPAGKYIAWWSDSDTAWFAWDARNGSIAQLTNNRTRSVLR